MWKQTDQHKHSLKSHLGHRQPVVVTMEEADRHRHSGQVVVWGCLLPVVVQVAQKAVVVLSEVACKSIHGHINNFIS